MQQAGAELIGALSLPRPSAVLVGHSEYTAAGEILASEAGAQVIAGFNLGHHAGQLHGAV